MGDHILKIHADEFEYTPQGLNSRGSIDLKVGAHNRVVITRPAVVKAVPVGFGGFARDSSFPTPVALAAMLAPTFRTLLRDILGSADNAYYQVFGHAEAEGNPKKNKALTDRRAKALAALLTGNAQELQALAESEGWGNEECQVMLRVLRCDPGVIDDNVGEMTTAAVKLFQQEYAQGVFHRHIEPDAAALLVDGVLGSQTRSALVEAFAVACSPQIPQERLHPSHPTVGCSEFNQIEDPPDNKGLNRRVALVVHETLPPFHENAPCTDGDHTVCPVDGEIPKGCVWYRAHVEDPTTKTVAHRHFDLRWLPLPNGKILLSGLTTLPDDEPVSFQVFRCKPISGPDDVSAENLAEPLSDELSGIVRLGVAQVAWEPPEGFNLFDVQSWIVPVSFASARELWENPHRSRPPVFRTIGGGANAISPAPGDDFTRLAARYDGDAEHGPQVATGVDAFGRYFQQPMANGRPAVTGNALDGTTRVVAVRFTDCAPVNGSED